MLRYIIGVTLIAAAIMLIRRLADGRMLKRHQYAIWLLIPLYMLISPFLRIKVTVTDEISSMIPEAFEKVVYENAYIDDAVPFAELEKMTCRKWFSSRAEYRNRLKVLRP